MNLAVARHTQLGPVFVSSIRLRRDFSAKPPYAVVKQFGTGSS